MTIAYWSIFALLLGGCIGSFVNVVIWSRVFDEYAVLIKTTNFLGVSGRLQVEDGVVHLVAESFWSPRVSAFPRDGGSRDFH